MIAEAAIPRHRLLPCLCMNQLIEQTPSRSTIGVSIMLKGALAAAAVIMACAPAGAVTRIVGSFSGVVSYGVYYSPEVPETLPWQTAKPEFSRNLPGEAFTFDINYDVGEDVGGIAMDGHIEVSNARSMGSVQTWVSRLSLTDQLVDIELEFNVPSFNHSGSFKFTADRNGSQLSNMRGEFDYAGQYYPVYAFWSVAGQVKSLGFDGQIDGFTIATSSVPEPSSWAMMIAGFGLVGAAVRQRPRYAMSRSLQHC